MTKKTKKHLLIRPKLAFENVGGNWCIKLNPKRIYRADVAVNQPDYKIRGKIFVDVKRKCGTDSFLLEKGDYDIVKRRKLKKVV
jgi:hypothetical protein